MSDLQVILIEDEQAVREATAQTLELAAFEVHAFASAEQAWPMISPDFGGILMTDVRLPGRSGLQVLSDMQNIDPDLPVVLVTGHGDVGMAVQAIRDGAYDFIEKPYSSEQLTDVCLRAHEKRRLVIENRRLRQALERQPGSVALIGQTAAIERVRQFIRQIGPAQVDVLIHGATGTGKEVVARLLHQASGRSGEFVAINCGALPEAVFESEIFGHEAGAFTGAQKRRIGKLEHANGGTVFLDEIESMPLNLQVKLLRVLQERKLERLGGNTLIELDCRIIAATKTDLLALSAESKFREDLYFRLAIVQLSLPRLKQRSEDIPLLLNWFAQQAAARYQRAMPRWTAEQMQQWCAQEWPGNVRELRNFADKLTLGLVDVQGPANPSSVPPTTPYSNEPPPAVFAHAEQTATDHHLQSLPRKLEIYEAGLISAALQENQGNVALTAQQLGIPKKTLYDKLKKYQIRYA